MNIFRVILMVAMAASLGSTAMADAPMIYCEGSVCGGQGGTSYAYPVDSVSYPMMEFRVGTNDLDAGNYRNVVLPQGWSFAVESTPMAHAHGLHTPHGDVSPGPCFCMTDGAVRFWTDDPSLAVEVFTFGFDHPWSPEDIGWKLTTQRDGNPPSVYVFSEFWDSPVGQGTGPVHGPSAPIETCSSNQDCHEGDYCFFRECADETGVCEPRPEGCPDVWDPVCGCDGVTYGNACEAAAAGMSVDYEGECEAVYCWENSMCAATEYCFFADCELETGVCEPRPEGCPEVWDPVCGCDGVTYGNACEAAAAGMSVDYEGECEPVYCWENDMCAATEYCFFADCGLESGVCEPRPEICPYLWDPVCGCDGETYVNACLAAAAGMSVDYEGECEPVHCWQNDMCAEAEYCYFVDCDIETGTCEPRPEACPDIYNPVCGCDGMTYSNGCYAAMAGVSVDYDGICSGGPCHGNDTCPADEYCFYAICTLKTGRCEPRPEACPDVWDPVCGCDGVTYSNACEAAAAGMSVDYEGECEPVYCWENDMCAATEYCFFAECELESGVCEPRPEGCPEVWDPVCGCDGVTYGNACEAAAAGMSVDYEGECEPVYCWENDMCAATEYCFFAECELESGVCEPRPEICPYLWDPVCGCDGETYVNACLAAAAGVSVDYEGECEPVHCWQNDMCAATEYCHFFDCELETGTCEPRPESCPDIYNPVCGCDGMTYSNGCYAAMAGVSVDFDGICSGGPCHGNDTCPADEYCFYAVCTLKTGRCEPRPEGCPDVWDPVCGCDGVTYSNACEAAAAGMSVDYEGECESAYCWENSMCAATEYCFFADCGLESGVCEPRPEVCTNILDPVCGCDGITYRNACLAAMAGMSVDYVGPCTGESCFWTEDCSNPELMYCEKTAGQCWEFGSCVIRPQACFPVYEPVCGCDGVTYGNACEAAMAGVSVGASGECETCYQSDECTNGGYCHSEDCDVEVGACLPIPTACEEYLLPTCGCDGITYDNPCMATAAGVSIDHLGRCHQCDINGDALSNLDDYTAFFACMNGPNNGIPLPCVSADLDGDMDVDLEDFIALTQCMDGGPRVDGVTDDGCVETPGGDPIYPCQGDDEIVILGHEPGNIQIIHQNATYNCCRDYFEASLVVDGNTIRLVETEVAENPCYCVCCYEVRTAVVGLATGMYTLEYCWIDESGSERCDTQQIYVP